MQKKMTQARTYLSRSHAHELWRLQRDTAAFCKLRVVDVEQVLHDKHNTAQTQQGTMSDTTADKGWLRFRRSGNLRKRVERVLS